MTCTEHESIVRPVTFRAFIEQTLAITCLIKEGEEMV
jgi:hypothetical protein